MPRLNPGRSIQVEANLARRIAHEREKRALSYEGLADAMTKAGCAINASSIYKIEKGDPPRRISVDELAALAVVFEEPLSELLVDMALIHQRRAQELIDKLSGIQSAIDRASIDAFTALCELLELEGTDPELAEYIEHHVDSRRGRIEAMLEGVEDAPTEHAEVFAESAALQVVQGSRTLWRSLLDAAELWTAFRRGTWTPRLAELVAEQVSTLRDLESASSEVDGVRREIRRARADG